MSRQGRARVPDDAAAILSYNLRCKQVRDTKNERCKWMQNGTDCRLISISSYHHSSSSSLLFFIMIIMTIIIIILHHHSSSFFIANLNPDLSASSRTSWHSKQQELKPLKTPRAWQDRGGQVDLDQRKLHSYGYVYLSQTLNGAGKKTSKTG